MPLIFCASSQQTECMPSSGFQWNFTKRDFPGRVDQPEGVNAEAFHHAKAARNRAIGHHPHEHVQRSRARAK